MKFDSVSVAGFRFDRRSSSPLLRPPSPSATLCCCVVVVVVVVRCCRQVILTNDSVLATRDSLCVSWLASLAWFVYVIRVGCDLCAVNRCSLCVCELKSARALQASVMMYGEDNCCANESKSRLRRRAKITRWRTLDPNRRRDVCMKCLATRISIKLERLR